MKPGHVPGFAFLASVKFAQIRCCGAGIGVSLKIIFWSVPGHRRTRSADVGLRQCRWSRDAMDVQRRYRALENKRIFFLRSTNARARIARHRHRSRCMPSSRRRAPWARGGKISRRGVDMWKSRTYVSRHVLAVAQSMTEGKRKATSHTSRIVREDALPSAVGTAIQGGTFRSIQIAGTARIVALPHPSVPQLHARWRSVAGPIPAARTDRACPVH